MFTQCGIANITDRLRANSASGDGNVSAQFLKITKDKMSFLLCHLFQASLESFKIPMDWKFAKVTPIHKSGDHKIPSIYRPISLTSILYKLFKHVINYHIMSYLNDSNFLFPHPRDFCKHLSCETQLFHLVTDLRPLLYLIYINDLRSLISSCGRLFADNCVVYRCIS